MIPFGVDTTFFRQINIPRIKNIFQIISIGYLIERKGFDYLINALKEVLKSHHEVKLTIVGSGPIKCLIEDLIIDLKLEKQYPHF